MPEGSASVPDFSELSKDALERMLAAGQEVVDCHRVLAKTGDNIVGELLRDAGPFYEWSHYPDGDVYDNATHSQYYYHAHPAEDRPGEHGHFHTFLRPKGMPPGARPAEVPDYEPPAEDNEALSHLVAISMDEKGFPFALFTVNRWVTADVWYRAEDVISFVDRFAMDLARPSWPVNRWITGMVQLFRPQIVQLLRARDRRIEEWTRQHPEGNPFTAHEIEVLSELRISIDEQVTRIQAALEQKG